MSLWKRLTILPSWPSSKRFRASLVQTTFSAFLQNSPKRACRQNLLISFLWPPTRRVLFLIRAEIGHFSVAVARRVTVSSKLPAAGMDGLPVGPSLLRILRRCLRGRKPRGFRGSLSLKIAKSEHFSCRDSQEFLHIFLLEPPHSPVHRRSDEKGKGNFKEKIRNDELYDKERVVAGRYHVKRDEHEDSRIHEF